MKLRSNRTSALMGGRIPYLCMVAVIWQILIHVAAAQRPGFVSIDCGSTSAYIDELGIEWYTDETFIATGENGAVKMEVTPNMNQRQFSTLRFFPQKRSKHCYSIPAVGSSLHLVRLSYLHGAFEPAVDNSFRLSIDSIIVQELEWSADYIHVAFFREFLVRTWTGLITLCLIPIKRSPFINSIEIRPLSTGLYNETELSDKYLRQIGRYGMGPFSRDFDPLSSEPPIRYPDDPYDRIWGAEALPTFGSEPFFSSIQHVRTNKTVDVGNVLAKPPSRVLQTAWTGKSNFSFSLSWSAWEENPTVYIIVFLADIVDDGRAPRMNLSVHGVTQMDKFTLAPPFVGRYIHHPSVVLSQPMVTFSFRGFWIFNAFEIYEVRNARANRTDIKDLETVEMLRNAFELNTWQGDPCLPVAFDWIKCSEGAVVRVTRIDLSNFNLTGTIPPQIASLTYLTELHLYHNKLVGSIPNLEGLSRLKILLLQNNTLSGEIPSSLASLPALTILDLSYNNFSGQVPSALSAKPGLDLQTNGNPNLCKPTGNCTTANAGIGGESDGDESNPGIVIGAVVGGLAFLLVIVCIFLWWNHRRKDSKTDSTAEAGSEEHVRGSAVVKRSRRFSFAELQVATSGFEKLIGEGGYGPVYYGILADGSELAVKVNSPRSGQGHREFLNEVALLSRVHHRNLVALLGYCKEQGQQILIYEYMSQGTLREHLYGKDVRGCLTWRQRLDVALNAAKGLEYLHNEISPRIIHRDIKSNNILLNEKLEAKVADFGVSKAAREGQTSGIMTVVLGTAGYLDPEYFQRQILTQKSDVYSFGVVLLEIISGKPPTIFDSDSHGAISLVKWARCHLQNESLVDIVDPGIRDDCDMETVRETVEVAMQCVQPHGANRPSITQVVQALNVILAHESSSSPCQ